MTSTVWHILTSRGAQRKGQREDRKLIEEPAHQGAACLARLPQGELEVCSSQIDLETLAGGSVTV